MTGGKATETAIPSATGYALAALLLSAIIGCGTPSRTGSGFLTDYDRLRPAPREEHVLYWEQSGIRWNQYRRLVIEPVQVRLMNVEPGAEVSKQEQEQLASSLHAALVSGLKDSYFITERAGPDTMIIRPALTHLKPVIPAVNVATTLLIGVPIDVGEAAVEVQFVDSLSGRILGELTASSKGSILDITGLDSMDQVHRAFRLWVERLRQAWSDSTTPSLVRQEVCSGRP